MLINSCVALADKMEAVDEDVHAGQTDVNQ